MMLKRKAITAERVELLQSWQHSGFNLNTTRRVAEGDRQSLETLLQYIERPPVSLRRLIYRPDGLVHYLGSRFHPGLGRDHQLVTPVEFFVPYPLSIRCRSRRVPCESRQRLVTHPNPHRNSKQRLSKPNRHDDLAGDLRGQQPALVGEVLVDD